jgi:hypothetical protein
MSECVNMYGTYLYMPRLCVLFQVQHPQESRVTLGVHVPLQLNSQMSKAVMAPSCRENGRLSEPQDYTAAIARQGRLHCWQDALALFRLMRGQFLEPSTIVVNAAIGACGKGQQWKWTLALLVEMLCEDL